MNVTGYIPRRQRFGRAVALLVVASAWCATRSSHAESGIPKPAKGHWAETTVALLQYSRDQCSGVGQRAVAYWRNLSGSELQASLDQYMLTRATADLQSARKALDIARDFLPRAISEIDAVQGKVLDVLYEAGTELCNVVAQPTPPLAEYENHIAAAESNVQAAKGKLDAIMLSTGDPESTEERSKELAKELAKELEPYQEIIDLAGGMAREQVREELEAETPPPARPTAQELMDRWYASYQQAVVPAKSALRVYLEARQRNDSTAIRTACKELQDTVLPLLLEDGKQIFQAPDAEVETPLKTVYTAMRRIGVRCMAGQFKEADEAYKWMQERLNRAAEVLAPYSLRP